MAIILLYSPFNNRSRDTESLMLAFKGQGHKIISLSQQEGYLINDFLTTNGIETHSYILRGSRSGWWYYFRHLIYFIRFCWHRQVDIVYSHLEPANFVASIGQYFIKAKTYLCRHHIDEGKLYKFDKRISYKITYSLARKIIVVSNHARKYMIEYEGIPAEKIVHINLAYNFSLYNSPEAQNVQGIRKQFKASILLLSACRLTAYKRPDAVIRTVKILSDQGTDVKLILLGKGEMQYELERLIALLGLQDKVFMLGYVSNVVEYMAAADFFVHASLLDSSCVTVKEAGLTKLPVIVCRGVGDFDDYLIHEGNAFLVDRDKFSEEAAEIVKMHFHDKELLRYVGENLRKSVLELFSIESLIERYSSLNTVR